MCNLKFRVWSKPSKKFLGEEAYFMIAINDKDGLNRPPYILEQYTDRIDKNGKEIYEGDIIQEELDFSVDSIDGTFRYKVVWDEETLCWSLDHIGNESIHEDLWECNSSVEVIGNIHENPDLLKEIK